MQIETGLRPVCTEAPRIAVLYPDILYLHICNMEIGIKDRVVEWARSGGDFSAGLSLFRTFNKNVFYIRNIEAKGVEKGLVTLVTEFSNKTKVSVNELMSMIEASQQDENIVITNPKTEDQRLKTEAENQRTVEGIRKTTKLREEFPFLGRKDCPEEFAILVNKMLTAYDDYRSDRDKLYDIDKNNLDACYQGARSVLDAYILNREIWEELNYFKIHGTILGKLPEFKTRGIKEKYESMSTVSLGNITGNNIPRKMSYYKKQLNDKATKNKDEIRAKMADAEDELSVIKKILIERGEI